MTFHTTKKGFTLVEIMIVIAIIALLAAIAVPNLMRSRLNANENNAISNMGTISAAAQTYWSVKNALPATLQALADEHIIDPTLGCAAPPCFKNGYDYAMEGAGVEAAFFVYAVPHTLNVTGIRSFCAGSDGVLRTNTAGTAPADQAACATWTVV